MSWRTARFCFHGELNHFLPREDRVRAFEHPIGATDTLKHLIESLGVPHTEIGSVHVNGITRALAETPAPGDCIEVFPHPLPLRLSDARFVLDGHLGRLAAYLRMLGFDTSYRTSVEDAEIAQISASEGRMLLTRDAGLLKRRVIEQGYFVRQHKPLDQLHEVSNRFDLMSQAAPFTRCMNCNHPLTTVSKEQIYDLLPPHTQLTKEQFSRCAHCGKLYWRGTHYERMLGWIATLRADSRQ